MSCYKVSNAVCEELDSRMVEFWWGEVEDRRRIHWRSWPKLCLPKEEVGLGFRDFKAFNQSLLAKQCWWIMMESELLVSRLFKGKYFPSQCFLNASKRSNPSWGWQSTLHGRDLLIQGLLWRLGTHTMYRFLTGSRSPGMGSRPSQYYCIRYHKDFRSKFQPL
ncbi:Uncharacterized mitochondrial protein AtMg00310 [Linum perenne]